MDPLRRRRHSAGHQTHRTARVSCRAAQVGRRTQFRLAVALPPPRPRLRTTHRTPRSHGLLGHRSTHDPQTGTTPHRPIHQSTLGPAPHCRIRTRPSTHLIPLPTGSQDVERPEGALQGVPVDTHEGLTSASAVTELSSMKDISHPVPHRAHFQDANRGDSHASDKLGATLNSPRREFRVNDQSSHVYGRQQALNVSYGFMERPEQGGYPTGRPVPVVPFVGPLGYGGTTFLDDLARRLDQNIPFARINCGALDP